MKQKPNNIMLENDPLMDVADCKHTIKALQESEERFRTLFESLPMAVQGHDSEGIIKYWNKACEHIYGYKKDEAIGKNIIDLIIPHENRNSMRKVLKQKAETEKMPAPEELLLMRKDGSSVPIFSTHSFVKLEDKEPEFYSFDVDITIQNELQSQLRQALKLESIGTLTGGVAHDFNNLLFMILGNIEIAIIDIPEGNPVLSNLKEVKSAGQRAVRIVKQLLNYSRKTDQELIPIGIVSNVNEILDFLRSTIPNTVEIRKKLPDFDVPILGDPIQINQFMMNLCINAAQAMEETGILEIDMKNVTLTDEDVSNYANLSTGNHIKITVSDSGPGISDDICQRIFDPYFTTKGSGEGSGMGLTIVNSIVENHNGGISVESEYGNGTCFTILFPIIDGTPEEIINTKIEIPHGTEKILFVDDEEPIVDMIGQILIKLGYKIETKLDPLEALDLFKRKPYSFDLVLTDMTMSHMTGVELSQKVKEIRHDIPVIICTGYNKLIDEDQVRQLDIDGYLMKPVSQLEMARTIRKVLDEGKL
ncbi:MAG: PAS domain S-box protein [Deltaproteobacteria bacterium]|nr:PAS domain S-box protein [Deltaproteobacteria bacterium]